MFVSVLNCRPVLHLTYHMQNRSRNFCKAVWFLTLVTSTAFLSTTLSQSAPDSATDKTEPKAPEPVVPAKPGLLARLGKTPDWSRLDAYQRTIRRTEFERLLHHNYLQDEEAAEGLIEILPDRARIIKQSNQPELGYYELFFLSDSANKSSPPPKVPRFWTPPWKLRSPLDQSLPLENLHIAIDPGHIGGEFAQIEQRWYRIGKDTIPITEGDMTLKVAKILESNLTALGARVSLIRDDTEPTTPKRADDLKEEAKKWLTRKPGSRKPSNSTIQSTAQRLFYVSSEIRARAELVNEKLKPDLVVCLHFNAEAWGNPRKPSFVDKNHNHILINGCYSKGEIEEDDERLELLLRLLQRTYYYELTMAEEVAKSMRKGTGLKAYTYTGTNAKSVNSNPYIWTRNLLANRLYLCPVIFLEPYVMNHKDVHARVQAGDYKGIRKIGKSYRLSIYREYAESVTAGLVNYFKKHRP